MSRYIMSPAYPDRMPVDISAVFADEKPAGKHGFCRADLQVWGIGPEGYPVGKLHTKFEDGTMTFTVGDKWPASYYIISAE